MIDFLKENRTKSIALIIILILITFIGYQATYAFLNDKDSKSNTFTVGNITTEIIEELDDQIIKPNTTMKKIVSIKNTSSVPCFIRARITISPEQVLTEKKIELTGLNTTLWKLEDDGFYYYQKQVQSQEVTKELLKGVKIGDLQEGDTFDVTIYQEAVQTNGHYIDDNGTKKQFSTLQEAWQVYDNFSKTK